jgi:broad specificity phosphatase PhoE
LIDPVLIVVAAIAMLVASALPAWAAQNMTITWVRHAQSTANAGGIIDTTVPGPRLTPKGVDQAVAVAAGLAAGLPDGIFVSDMIRTGLTAAPLVDQTGIQPVTIGGVREIAAGILEGLPGTPGVLYDITNVLYTIPVALWSLGARSIPTLFGEDGNSFNARMTDALATVYASDATNAVIFSHGAAIQAWTLMNTANPVLRSPLGNTDTVVVVGNPVDGWTLQSWAGETVAATPDLPTKLLLNVRDLIVAPQTAVYNVVQSLKYSQWFTDGSSLVALVAAIRDGVVQVVTAAVDFVQSTIRDITGAFGGAAPSVSAATAKALPARLPAASEPPTAAAVTVAAPDRPLRKASPTRPSRTLSAADQSSAGRPGAAARAGRAGISQSDAAPDAAPASTAEERPAAARSAARTARAAA